MISFLSCLGPEIQDFLAIREKNCSTSAYAHDRQIMEHLDRYLTKTGCSDKNLTEQTVLGWIATLSGKSSTIANKVIVLRIFLNFLLGYGIHAYVPHIPKVRDDYIPYIFSECEMDDIFREADSLTKGTAVVNGMLHLQMPMILRLMYGCGLRIGETLQLRMEDIDLEQGLLTLRKTKGGKQRLVPMHDSLTDILRAYCCALGLIGNPDMLLFPTNDPAVPTTPPNASHRFDRILASANIQVKGRKPHERGPCMHCLRHVFAFRSFSYLERSGIRTDDAIPYLSIYLGHDSLQETEKYMKFSSELFPDASEMFAQFTENLFPEVCCEE